MRIIRDHKVRTSIISLVFGYVVVALLFNPVVLQGAADLWIVSDPLDKPADAIVILAGGYDRRARVAANLYERGLGREVWITHSDSKNNSSKNEKLLQSAEEFSRAALIKLGVPEAAIVNVPGEAFSTYEEAGLVSSFASVTAAESLIIPTDAFHTLRVKWTYNKRIGEKSIRVTVRPIFQLGYSQEQWWQSSQGRSDFAGEFVKYLYYRIRY